MGGLGSGRRWRYDAKSTTDDYRAIDVRHWAREGVLKPGCSCTCRWTRGSETVASIQTRAIQNYVVLTYRHCRHGGEWKEELYPVRVVRTPCHLGGSRAWFLCPAGACRRRVAILYCGGGIFACRHCHQLASASSREDPGSRATRRADRLRARLGWEPGILNGPGMKPKWMRWRTFERLIAQHDQLVGRSMQALASQFKLTRIS